MSTYDFDLFVIGAGSGGVRASRIAAGHGARVAIAEEYRVGGTCVIRGCVPKKLLVYGAHFSEDLKDACRFGWSVENPRFDWAALRDTVQSEVNRLEGAYRSTLNNHNVTLMESRAVITGPHSVRLADGREVTSGTILIAVGGTPHRPDFPGAEHGITSNEVFHLDQLPRRIIIAGGGYIANEFAGIFNAMGSKVTVVNRGDQILRGYDEQLRDRLLKASMDKGIDFYFNAPFQAIEKSSDGALAVHLGGRDVVYVDVVLFAMGRKPMTEGLGLEVLGVDLDKKGAVRVDEDSRSSIPSIYAVGDVTDRIQLTPVAIREGHAFADTVFGNKPWRVDHGPVPKAVFSYPPIASVGLTESEARQKYGPVRVYTSDFLPMKNALAGRKERALYKMIVDEATDVVIGLHMIGPDSPEILQAAAIAIKAGLTKADFDATVALHPSMAEELVLMR